MADLLVAGLAFAAWHLAVGTTPLAFAPLHAGVFVVALMWMGTFTARIEPAAGTLVARTATLILQPKTLQVEVLEQLRADGAEAAGFSRIQKQQKTGTDTSASC